MKKIFTFVTNPFNQIAGFQALTWGVLGMVISTMLCWLSGWHYKGLLLFGPAPNPDWWCYAIEHLTVWLIPSILFYIGGLILSRSRIRLIDVFGTVAFAQLPLIIMNIVAFLPPIQQSLARDISNMTMAEISQQPGQALATLIFLISLVFLIWTLIWMFKALKVSCNLKGYRLGVLYGVVICGGEIVIRYLISLCY